MKVWGVMACALVCAALPVAARPPVPPALRVVDAAALAAELTPSAGRTLVVHAWASWCRPCVAELPELARLFRRAAGTDVVFLSLDDASAADRAARALARAGMPGRRLRIADGAALAPLRRLDPEWDGALPATFVIAADGRLAASARGFTDFAALAAQLQEGRP